MSDNRELLNFLAHSLELESEAGERYAELAESMQVHNNLDVAAFFERMAKEAEHHLAEVQEIVGNATLPLIAAWDFQWPDAEAPESASYESVHYRMTLAEAMQLALLNELAAERYYRGVAEGSDDPQTAAVADRFAQEESSHAEALRAMLVQLPESPTLGRLEDDDPHMPE